MEAPRRWAHPARTIDCLRRWCPAPNLQHAARHVCHLPRAAERARRPVRAGAPAGPGRDGDRLPRARPLARPARRHQAPASGARRSAGAPGALSSRGAHRGPALPPPHRADPRGRGARRARALRHGIRGGRDARPADRAGRPAAAGGGGADPPGGGVGARLRAPARRRAPRRQARQYPPRAGERPRGGERLRHRAVGGRLEREPAGRSARDGAVHESGAARRRAGRRAERSLRARCHRAPGAHRRAAGRFRRTPGATRADRGALPRARSRRPLPGRGGAGRRAWLGGEALALGSWGNPLFPTVLVYALFVAMGLGGLRFMQLVERARRLLGQGYTLSDVRAALDRPEGTDRQRLPAVTGGSAPLRTWFPRRLLPIAGVGGGALWVLAWRWWAGHSRGPIVDGLLFALLTLVPVVLLRGLFARLLRPGRKGWWSRLWWKVMEWKVFKVAGLGTGRTAVGASEATEVALGAGAQALFEAMPRDLRDRFADLPAVLMRLEEQVRRLREAPGSGRPPPPAARLPPPGEPAA